MKNPKRINSKRPSLWLCDDGLVRLLYPDGRVIFCSAKYGIWLNSSFTGKNLRTVIKELEKNHIFVSYL